METTIALIAKLSLLFQQLGIVLDARNLWTLAAMTALLMKGKRAQLYELARALPCQGKLESRVQKLRRWVTNPSIAAFLPTLFLPAMLTLLAPVLAQRPKLPLIIDRTSWTRLGVPINLFLCSIAFNGRSCPIFWIMLPTRGCSSLSDQKALLTPVLHTLAAHPLLSPLPKTVVADREFCSPLLAKWLKEQGIHFCIRVKKNYHVSRSDIPTIPISHFLEHCQRGHTYFYEHIRLTDEHQVPVNLLIDWRSDCDEPIALISDLEEATAVKATYPERTFIETLNRDLKSGGFDVERGKMTDSMRLSNLLIPMAFAYTLAIIQGSAEEVFQPVPPGKKRTHSLFTQARNRITDLLERTSLNIIIQFFEQFFEFLHTLFLQKNGETTHKLFRTYVRQQCLLLKGFHSSVRY
jgi:hypothetical protein